MKEKLIPIMKSTISEFYGEKLSNSEDLGRIVTDRNFNRLMKLLNSTKGKIEIGGENNQEDRFIEFTLVSGVKDDGELKYISFL